MFLIAALEEGSKGRGSLEKMKNGCRFIKSGATYTSF